MGDVLRVREIQFSYGCREAIADRTVHLGLGVTGRAPDAVLDGLERGDGLPLADAVLLHADDDWVASCLIGGRGPSRLADLAAALIVLLQQAARAPVFQAQVIQATPDRIGIALPWFRQTLTREAIALALACLAQTEPGGRDLTARISAFLVRERRGGLAPNSMRFARAAVARDMPIALLNQQTLRIGWGAHARLFRSSFTDRTGSLAERLARDKLYCAQRLKEAHLPVPEQRFVRTPEQALAAAEDLGWPVVLKPVGLDQGRGVHVGITSPDALAKAFQAASRLQDHGVVVERLVPGHDHRILVVNGRMMMAAQRLPGGIVADGKRTVRALLAALNADPRRGDDPRSLLIRVPLDDEALSCLDEAGLTPDSIPETGRFVPLRRTANISTGGTAVDVTDRVHPDNRIAAIRAARVVGLDIAGVDFICPDISVSYRDGGGAICEINAQPGFRPHWLSNPERDINGEILDVLFADRPARIPVAAITGTNGKSTTAMMLHHIWQTAGKTAGVCTTVGTWVGPDRIDTRNLSGRPGADLLLADPAVEAAILEKPRLGLIRFGHACDHYDVAALLNIQNDHLGQDGIETLEDMARLKSGVIRRARVAVVVNAEDPLCLQALKTATAPRRILVAMDQATPALAAHLEAGGDGIFTARQDDADWIVMARGARRVPVMPVSDIPATLGGVLRFNVMNAMFAIALADAQNLSGPVIRQALSGFESSREMNPGRYNMVTDLPFRVIVDYAHNEQGVAELCRVVQALPETGRRLLAVQILGNSGPEKLRTTLPSLLPVFDRIAILSNLASIRKYGWYTSPDPEEEMLQTARSILAELGAADGQALAGRGTGTLVADLLRSAAPDDVVVLMLTPDRAFAHLDRFRADMGASGPADG